MARLMKDYFQTNALERIILKYVAIQLNTFVNLTRKFESDVI